MSLYQAVGVIFGANIGTTITSQLVSFNLSEVAPVVVFGGAIAVMFSKNETVKKVGEIFLGFGILFNIQGFGMVLCALGGVLSWVVYLLVLKYSGNDITAYFWAALVSAAYSEIMARIRKYPAISYLVVAIFPLIPGAGVYYTMNHAIQGRMDAFFSQGMHTAAIAGVIAVGILLVSTIFRMYSQWKRK